MTPQGQLLADRHRVAQGTLAQATVAQILRLWPLLVSGGAIDANTPRWLELALAVMAAQRAQSAALAAQFATAFRAVEAGTLDGFSPTPAIDLNLDAARTSLMVLGPQAYKKQIAKQLQVEPGELRPVDLVTAKPSQGLQAKMAANAARASARHVQNGARDTIEDVIKTDSSCIGWVRTTKVDPCYFCAMLASRGPVYDDDSFEDSDPRFSGPGDHKVHDGCGCMLLPMYRRPRSDAEQAAFDRYKEYDALWRTTGSVLKFRQAYEGRAST